MPSGLRELCPQTAQTLSRLLESFSKHGLQQLLDTVFSNGVVDNNTSMVFDRVRVGAN